MTTIRELPENAAHAMGRLTLEDKSLTTQAYSSWHLLGPSGETIAVFTDRKNRQANARRIIACWNACQGIPTEILEVQNPS